MKSKKQIAIIILSLVMVIIGCLSTLEVGVTAKAAKSKYGISKPRVTSGKSTWDTVYFGNYYQSSSRKKEPIRWRVLWVNGNDAFLLSEKILIDHNFSSFSSSWNTCNRLWENCDLREYLNNDFYNEAFSDVERAAIITTTVKNRDNNYCAYSGYNNNCGTTYDNIYCLSFEEATNPSYGFDNRITESPYLNDYGLYAWSDTRVAVVTNYVLSTFEGSTNDGRCNYWLRDPSYNGMDAGAASVDCSGYVMTGSSSLMSCRGVTVRPVLHLDLSQTELWKKGSTVSARNSLKLSCKHKYKMTPYWDNEGKSCQVEYTCKRCDGTKLIDAKVSSQIDGNIRKCKASAKYKSVFWTQTKKFNVQIGDD